MAIWYIKIKLRLCPAKLVRIFYGLKQIWMARFFSNFLNSSRTGLLGFKSRLKFSKIKTQILDPFLDFIRLKIEIQLIIFTLNSLMFFLFYIDLHYLIYRYLFCFYIFAVKLGEVCGKIERSRKTGPRVTIGFYSRNNQKF